MQGWRGLGFSVFCLLAGSRWLVESAYPSALPPLQRQAIHFGVMGLAVAVVWRLRRRSWPGGWLHMALAGMLLLGVPSILERVAGPVVNHTGAALFTLAPLFVVVGVVAFGEEDGARALMMPALVGAAGGLLVLPFELPTTAYGGVLFGVALGAVVSTAVGGIWLHRLLQGADFAPAVAVVLGANAVLLGVAAGVLEGTPAGRGYGEEALWGVAVELPMSLLLLWLVREVVPVRLAGRFLFVPLVTVAEGWVLLRPGLDWRLGLGVLLMVVGCVMLLWRVEEGEMRLGLG